MSHQGFRLLPSATDAERVLFHAACDVTTRCWTWLGSRNSNGYGFLGGKRGPRFAHRVSYETFVGPIADGLQIDHLCRNPRCVNPEHLEAVTPQINVRRGESPGARALRRTHCLAGHDYATHGVVRVGRRICRTCRNEYLREYGRARRAARAEQWAVLMAERPDLFGGAS